MGQEDGGLLFDFDYFVRLAVCPLADKLARRRELFQTLLSLNFDVSDTS